MTAIENRILQIVYSMAMKDAMQMETKGKIAYTDYDTDQKNLLAACREYVEKNQKVCGTCALFYANGLCHKDPKNPVIMRSGEPACADYHSRSACNNGDCERHKLGAEPCADCPFCDENGEW